MKTTAQKSIDGYYNLEKDTCFCGLPFIFGEQFGESKARMCMCDCHRAWAKEQEELKKKKEEKTDSSLSDNSQNSAVNHDFRKD